MRAQKSSHSKALDVIYTIDMLLRRSDLKFSAKTAGIFVKSGVSAQKFAGLIASPGRIHLYTATSSVFGLLLTIFEKAEPDLVEPSFQRRR